MIRPATQLGLTAAALSTTGATAVVTHFTQRDQWFSIGLVLGGVGLLAAMLTPIMLTAVRISDAYRYGWDSGYAKGRRSAQLRIVPSRDERRQTRGG